MKSLRDIQLFGTDERPELRYSKIRENHLVDFPITSFETLITRQAELCGDQPALKDDFQTLSYTELEKRSAQFGSALRSLGLTENSRIGFLLTRSIELVIGAVSCMRERMTYVPIDVKHPTTLVHHMIEQAEISCLICTADNFSRVLPMVWEIPTFQHIICIDTEDCFDIIEIASERMNRELWDNVGHKAFDEVSAGGWKSSYTGDWLSQETMAAYRKNAEEKLRPFLNRNARVLEIGCGSGITTRAIAENVNHVTATDLSASILAFAESRLRDAGVENVRFLNYSTDELGELTETFDLIVMNSVVQSFHGYAYLKKIIHDCMELLNETGTIFIGNVWDAALKADYFASIDDYRKANGLAAKAHGDMFFVHTDFFEFLKNEIPELKGVDVSKMRSDIQNELQEFSYDLILSVDKRNPKQRTVGNCTVNGKRLLNQPILAKKKSFSTDHLAYIIFTSGSTGLPKGVGVSEKSLLNLMHWYSHFCGIDEQSRVLHTISPAFDASVKNMLTPLITGARLFVFADNPNGIDPSELLNVIEREQISVLNPGVPSIIYPVIELAAEMQYQELSTLRFLALGGETPNASKLKKWTLSENCNCTVANIYGPTECTDIALARVICRDDWERLPELPIGFPVSNNYFYLLDENRIPVEPGFTGELAIGGAGLSLGYINQPELTDKQFIDDPYREGEKIYLTGDLAVFNETYGVFYKGRRDNQVKVRGHRIELAAVENTCMALPEVADAAVVCRNSENDATIVLFAVAERKLEPLVLKAMLKNFLPEYMLPDEIVFLESLPKNVNGKTDRKQLVMPQKQRQLIVPPGNETEQKLLDIWKELLREKEISVTDNFFSLGGHSLLVAALVTRIRKQFGIHFPLVSLYEHTTIAAQAFWLTQNRSEDCLFSALTDGQHVVIAFPPISGQGIVFEELAHRLNNVRFLTSDFRNRQDLAASYADELLKTVDIPRNIFIIGYSAGCVIAFQVASALEKKGFPPQQLILIDGAPPEKLRYTDEQARAVAAATVADRFSTSDEAVQHDMYELVFHYAKWISNQQLAPLKHTRLSFISSEDRGDTVMDAWRNWCSGDIDLHWGKGKHFELLQGSDGEYNFEIIQNILDNGNNNSRNSNN